jgi:MFS family permease
MAYDPQLETDEQLTLQIAFKVSEKATAFNFAVSDQAVYWPATKAFAVNDATYFKRIRINEISEICIRRLPPYGLWVLATLMVLAGFATAFLIFAPLINHEPGKHSVSGWPFALIVGGILMPLATKGRLGLEVKTLDKTFRWKPPLVVDKTSKVKIRTTFAEIVAACKRSGLKVTLD